MRGTVLIAHDALHRSQAVVAGDVLLVDLVAGYANPRARPTWATVVVHFPNDLYSALAN